jgi:Tfp pilus assembly protein PilF
VLNYIPQPFDNDQNIERTMRNTRAVAAAVAASLLGSFVLVGCGGAESRLSGHMQRGQEYLAAENYEKARVEFRNALQVAPDDPNVRFMNASAAEKLGALGDAARLYQSTIDIKPDHVQARAALGRMFLFGGAPERAKELVEPALVTHPDDPELLAVRGAARMNLKDRDGALADAEKAVKLAPDNENAVALLAAIYRERGEPTRAVELLDATLQRLPSSTDLRGVLVSLYESLNQPDLIEEQLRKSVEIKPDDLRLRRQLAMSYVRTKKLDEA